VASMRKEREGKGKTDAHSPNGGGKKKRKKKKKVSKNKNGVFPEISTLSEGEAGSTVVPRCDYPSSRGSEEIH